jgi:two-component system cell cycle response regulator
LEWWRTKKIFGEGITSEDLKPGILIAEDDPVSRRLLETILRKWNYQVIVATNGSEALRILESDAAPPLAILDWMMPEMEGPEVCRRIRSHSGNPYIYILMLTARTLKDDLLRGLESGADDYLTKPFDAQELRARLQVGQRILDLQRSLIAAREDLRFQATHDTLTGISNRGAILEALTREHSRRAREGGSFGIILVDLDHFKEVNDTFGHLSGDLVLREASRRMSACIRPYDVFGRYGGEEFLLVVPSSNEAGTLNLAERIRVSLASEAIATERGEIRVTASLGVAVCNDNNPPTLPNLLRLCDEALYRAKRGGRNRSAVAPAGGADSPLRTEPSPIHSKF